MLKLFTKLLPALAAALLLNSCAGDVMQVMKDRNQPVGVLMVKPGPTEMSSVSVASTGASYYIEKHEVDEDVSRTAGGYHENAKTFHAFGNSIVSRLRKEGINARLLDSYPAYSGLVDDEGLRPRYRNLPGEVGKYPVILIVNERTVVGSAPYSSSIRPGALTRAAVVDTASQQVLSTSYLIPAGAGPIPPTSRSQIHRGLGEAVREARQSLLDEVFYELGE